MAKKFNNTLKTTLIILGIASVIAGVVYSYGILNDNVVDNAVAIIEQKDESKSCMSMNIRQDMDVMEIKADMRYMKEDVAEIKDGMKQQTTILHEVLREVRK